MAYRMTDDIIRLFTDHWSGTPEQLAEALEVFFDDVLHDDIPDYKLANEYRVEAEDYFTNHYGVDEVRGA